MAKKHDSKDRLSLLSDDILIKILCLTKSYKCAVICSVVSKQWRNLYKKLPHLYLYEHDFYNGTVEKWKRKKQDVTISTNIAFALSRHQEKVHTISLQGTLPRHHIWEWCLEHLIPRYDMEHISLILQGRFDEPQPSFLCFPECIFSCSSLVTLILDCKQSWSLEIPETFQGFPNLHQCVLSLGSDCNAGAAFFNSLVAKCCALQKLKVTLDFPAGTPIVISSPSLLNLDVELLQTYLSSRKMLQIKVETPELLVMRLVSNLGLYFEVEAHVEAPKLLRMSLPIYNFALHMNVFPKGIKGVYKVEWSKKNHHMISLECISPSMMELNSKRILSMISDFNTLKFLSLSQIHVFLKDFCRMMASLPMLEKLVLGDCFFKKESKQKYLDGEKCNMSKLTEVFLTNTFQFCLEGEREIISIVLQISPNLKVLHFLLEEKKLAYKNEYAAIFGQLLRNGDYLNLKESSEQVEFTIFKKSVPPL